MLKVMRESFHHLKWTLFAVIIVFVVGFVFFSGGNTNSRDLTSQTVARIGGDQFGIAWRMAGASGVEVGRTETMDPGTTGTSAMDASARSAALATRLITALATPTRLAGHTLFVRASIGMALAPADALDAATLFSHAEAALMRAKQAGRNQYRRHGDDDHFR